MTVQPLQAPEYVLWEITLACNLRCRHCLTSSGHASPDELSTEEALDVCEQLARLDAGAVALMGGEPLVRDDWPVLCERLRSHHIPVGLVTNGVLFDQETARRAREAGVGQVVVSLDGPEKAHEKIRGRRTFGRALEAVRIATSQGFAHRMVMTSVSKANAHTLPELLPILLEEAPGATWAVNLTSIRPGQRIPASQAVDVETFEQVAAFVARARQEHAGVLDVMGAHDLGYHSLRYQHIQGEPFEGCNAGISTLGITASGDVKGCLALPGMVEGNVRSRRLVDLWKDPELFGANRAFTEDQLGELCAGCVHGATCRGGCMEISLTVTGRPHNAPFCLHRNEREDVA